MNERLKSIQPGDRVGPYRVVRRFKGRGGMGGVFEVKVRKKHRQPHIPDRLALKVASEDYQAALVAESDYLRRFDHPNVVRIYPIAGAQKPIYAARTRFRFGWGWYYAMELVRGGSMERYMTRPTAVTGWIRSDQEVVRRLGRLQAVGIARQLAGALDHIHQHHVINLDVKPGNVLFRRRKLEFLRNSVPQAVLCDFGISRDLRYPRAGELGIATPEYASPEQIPGAPREVDVRSDIFSLGVVLYEMLTGRLPFENVALTSDPTYAPPPPSGIVPSIPGVLEDVVMRALAKNPEFRFRSAGEMQAALEQVDTPFDWRATARRVVAAGSLAGCLALGGWGVSHVVDTDTTPTPKSKPGPTNTTVAPAATSTAVETDTPDVSPTETEAMAVTSTPRPTFTPTNTPVPPTSTPTPDSTSNQESGD